jgi:hypothetical protein
VTEQHTSQQQREAFRVFEPMRPVPPITTIFMVRLRLEARDKTATGSVCSTRTLSLVNVGVRSADWSIDGPVRYATLLCL